MSKAVRNIVCLVVGVFGWLTRPAQIQRVEDNQTVQWLDDSRHIIQDLNQRFDTTVAERLPRLIKGLNA